MKSYYKPQLVVTILSGFLLFSLLLLSLGLNGVSIVHAQDDSPDEPTARETPAPPPHPIPAITLIAPEPLPLASENKANNLPIAIWYVATTGSDSDDCATELTPCATINGAIGKAAAGDTIKVASGIYTSSDSQVVLINKNVSLSGGWDLDFSTESGYSEVNGQNERFGIVISYGMVVDINNFIVRNGYSDSNGGGIINEGALTISNSTVTNNYAWRGAGILNFGSFISIENSTINNSHTTGGSASSGGGIYNGGGNIVIKNSTIKNNSTEGAGGGIYNGGNLIIENSTIFGNTADLSGGGIYHNAYELTINNSTVSKNSALEDGGGIYNYVGSVSTNNVTISENYGRGFSNTHGTFTLKNTISAGNIKAGGPFAGGPDCYGSVSGNNNIIGNNISCSLPSGNGNLLNVDPQLSAFLAYPGFQPLLSNSPAINAGNSCYGSTDQRGAPRVGACDIGAYEYRAPQNAIAIYPTTDNLRLTPDSLANTPIQVVALDSWSTPVSGVTVILSAPLNGPSGVFTNGTSTISTVTGANGISSSGFIANSIWGSYEIDAYAPSLNVHAAIYVTNFGLFVSNTGNDSNNCLTPAMPCATINGALAKASNGDTINVAEGRYTKKIDDSWSVFVYIQKEVTISGGWDSTFSVQNGLSIIDGEGIYEGVFNSSSNSTLANFIITNSSNGVDNSRSGSLITLNRVAIINNVGIGVINYEGNMLIKNTTISGNGSGGINSSGGNITIANSTITNNLNTHPTSYGGGIRNTGGTVKIYNSIVANNSAPQAPDCYNYDYGGASLISNGYNIIGSTTGCTIIAKSGDQFNVDPQLLPLAPSGYQPLKPASPAIDAGNPAIPGSGGNACLAIDQRGFVRPQGAYCDIGAFERAFRYVATTGSNTTPVINNCMNSLSPCQTINYAISQAVNDDTIYIAAGTYAETYSSDISIQLLKSLEIIGAGMNLTLLDGGGTRQVISIPSAITYLKDLTIQKGKAPALTSGGGIYSGGTLTLTRVKVTDNSADGGGGIMSDSALTMTDSIVSNNTATTNAGGGIFINDEAANLINVTISGNTAHLYGGGIQIQNSAALNLTNVTISGNTAQDSVGGGGISASIGTITILNSTIANNHVSVSGPGGITNYGTLNIKNTIVAGNDGNECGPYGTWNSQGYNISSDASCNFTNTGDQPNTDPLLRPLTNNGGTTQTHALLSDSPAIDTGTNTGCPSKDQRGVTRPQDGNLDSTFTCDIGAYEFANTFDSISQWTKAFDLSHGWTVQNSVRTLGDISGDGKADLVGFGADGVYVAVATGTGFETVSKLSSSFGLANNWTVQNSVRTLGDVTGDGKADLIGFGADGVYVAVATGTGFGPVSQWSSSFGLANGWTVQGFVRTVGDVTGDGKADLVGFGADGVYVAVATGTGFETVTKLSSSFGLANGWMVQNSVRTVGDVTGDGKADLVGFGQDGVYVAVATGTGFETVTKLSSSFGLANGWTVQGFVRTVGDITGDGKADLVGFGADGVYVAVATGTGFGAVTQWSPGFGLANGWTVQGFVRTVGDVTGDGRADLVGFGADGVYVAIAQ